MPGFVIAVSLTLVILFFTMVLSIMASVEAEKHNHASIAKARQYSIYSAVISGVACLTVLAGLLIHGMDAKLM